MSSRRLFKRLVWGLGISVMAVFVFVTFMISRPDAYEEHIAQPVSVGTWPDGSPRTAHDWWAHPGASLDAQTKTAPASSHT
jgi:hypothetical protein